MRSFGSQVESQSLYQCDQVGKGRLASERPPRILKKVFFADVIQKLKLHLTSETVKFDSPSSPRHFEEMEKVFVEDALEIVMAVTAPL